MASRSDFFGDYVVQTYLASLGGLDGESYTRANSPYFSWYADDFTSYPVKERIFNGLKADGKINAYIEAFAGRAGANFRNGTNYYSTVDSLEDDGVASLIEWGTQILAFIPFVSAAAQAAQGLNAVNSFDSGAMQQILDAGPSVEAQLAPVDTYVNGFDTGAVQAALEGVRPTMGIDQLTQLQTMLNEGVDLPQWARDQLDAYNAQNSFDSGAMQAIIDPPAARVDTYVNNFDTGAVQSILQGTTSTIANSVGEAVSAVGSAVGSAVSAVTTAATGAASGTSGGFLAAAGGVVAALAKGAAGAVGAVLGATLGNKLTQPAPATLAPGTVSVDHNGFLETSGLSGLDTPTNRSLLAIAAGVGLLAVVTKGKGAPHAAKHVARHAAKGAGRGAVKGATKTLHRVKLK